MKIFMVLGGEKTKPIPSGHSMSVWNCRTDQSQTNPILGKGKSKKAKGKMRANPEFLRWAI